MEGQASHWLFLCSMEASPETSPRDPEMLGASLSRLLTCSLGVWMSPTWTTKAELRLVPPLMAGT